MASRNFIEARDGTRLFFKTVGEGRPVLLIHGWPLSADSWDPLMIALAEAGFRAIAYDRRGFGRSEQTPAGYDYNTFADDLLDIMDGTGATDDVALVGFSMGGGEIVRYMSRHGGTGVSQAVLVSPTVPFMLRTADNPHGFPQARLEAIFAGMRKDYRQFFTTYLKDFYGVRPGHQPVSDEQLEWAWRTAMMVGQYPALKSFEAFATTDFRPELAHLNVPTLVIHGTANETVPIDSTSRALAAQLPNARLIEYDGEPHALFATQQDRLARDVLDFLDRPTRDVVDMGRRMSEAA